MFGWFMKYRLSSSFFALLFCLEFGTVSSLHAMENDSRGTFISIKKPSIVKDKGPLKEAEEKFLGAASFEEIEQGYQDLSSLTPENIGDYELYASVTFLSNNFLDKGLHLFSLASLRDTDKMDNNVKAFLPFFQEKLDQWIKEQKDEKSSKSLQNMWCANREKDLGSLRNDAFSLLNFINKKLSTETYELIFKIIHEIIYKSDKNAGDTFLKLVYKLGNPPGLRIHNIYLNDILSTDKNTSNAEKYKVATRIATDPLFLNNTPPRSWITYAREGILAEYAFSGIREKDNKKVEEYCKTNIKDRPHFYNEMLLNASVSSGDWATTIVAIDEKAKYTDQKDMQQLLLVKLALLEHLGRTDEVLMIITERLTNHLKSVSETYSKPKRKSGSKTPSTQTKSSSLEKEQPVHTVKKKKKKKKKGPIESESIKNNNLEKIEKIIIEKQLQETAPISFDKIEPSFIEEKEKEEEPVVKKEKVKTKGVSDPSRDTKRKPYVNEAKEEENEETSSKDILEILSGNPLKTFMTLFEPYKGQIKWKNLKISFEEIENLFEALNHEVGLPKGSHAKATLNNNGQIQKDAEEKMLVIVKDTYLHPAALQQIAKTFIEYGLYPKELETLLRKKMLILDVKKLNS